MRHREVSAHTFGCLVEGRRLRSIKAFRKIIDVTDKVVVSEDKGLLGLFLWLRSAAVFVAFDTVGNVYVAREIVGTDV